MYTILYTKSVIFALIQKKMNTFEIDSGRASYIHIMYTLSIFVFFCYTSPRYEGETITSGCNVFSFTTSSIV